MNFNPAINQRTVTFAADDSYVASFFIPLNNGSTPIKLSYLIRVTEQVRFLSAENVSYFFVPMTNPFATATISLAYINTDASTQPFYRASACIVMEDLRIYFAERALPLQQQVDANKIAAIQIAKDLFSATVIGANDYLLSQRNYPSCSATTESLVAAEPLEMPTSTEILLRVSQFNARACPLNQTISEAPKSSFPEVSLLESAFTDEIPVLLDSNEGFDIKKADELVNAFLEKEQHTA